MRFVLFALVLLLPAVALAGLDAANTLTLGMAPAVAMHTVGVEPVRVVERSDGTTTQVYEDTEGRSLSVEFAGGKLTSWERTTVKPTVKPDVACYTVPPIASFDTTVVKTMKDHLLASRDSGFVVFGNGSVTMPYVICAW